MNTGRELFRSADPANRYIKHGPTEARRRSVKVEELFLAACEPTSVNSLRRIDAHSLERRMMRDGGDDEPSVVFEANEPAIEEVINTIRFQRQESRAAG